MAVWTWTWPRKNYLLVITRSTLLHATLQRVERAFAKLGQCYMWCMINVGYIKYSDEIITIS